jgi:hypothetical protein
VSVVDKLESLIQSKDAQLSQAKNALAMWRKVCFQLKHDKQELGSLVASKDYRIKQLSRAIARYRSKLGESEDLSSIVGTNTTFQGSPGSEVSGSVSVPPPPGSVIVDNAAFNDSLILPQFSQSGAAYADSESLSDPVPRQLVFSGETGHSFEGEDLKTEVDSMLAQAQQANDANIELQQRIEQLERDLWAERDARWQADSALHRFMRDRDLLAPSLPLSSQSELESLRKRLLDVEHKLSEALVRCAVLTESETALKRRLSEADSKINMLQLNEVVLRQASSDYLFEVERLKVENAALAAEAASKPVTPATPLKKRFHIRLPSSNTPKP